VAPILVVGMIERDRDRFYNAAIAINRGALIARYRKVHLLGGERAIFDSLGISFRVSSDDCNHRRSVFAGHSARGACCARKYRSNRSFLNAPILNSDKCLCGEEVRPT
jgi:hypothetical protein